MNDLIDGAGIVGELATTQTTRCLSIRQPWCFAIIHGQKRIENRSWRTNYRGSLVIHASSNRKDFLETPLSRWREIIPEIRHLRASEFGRLYGLLDLVDCVPFKRSKGKPYAEGEWCWLVENPRLIRSVPHRGRTLLFDLPEGLVTTRT